MNTDSALQLFCLLVVGCYGAYYQWKIGKQAAYIKQLESDCKRYLEAYEECVLRERITEFKGHAATPSIGAYE
jgi:hypothetical protein